MRPRVATVLRPTTKDGPLRLGRRPSHTLCIHTRATQPLLSYTYNGRDGSFLVTLLWAMGVAAPSGVGGSTLPLPLPKLIAMRPCPCHSCAHGRVIKAFEEERALPADGPAVRVVLDEPPIGHQVWVAHHSVDPVGIRLDALGAKRLVGMSP